MINIINNILGYFSYDIGIDLGTANTLVYVEGKGIAIREPSVVARNKKTKEILAIGGSAKKMLGRAPSTIEIIRPLRDGVIADFDGAFAMLDYYIKSVHESGGLIPKIPRPKVVIGIPSGVTEVERRAVAQAAIASGARVVHLIEEPMAAALGAGLKIEDATGKFIVDIGGGTTEIAAVSMGGSVVSKSIKTAGDEIDEAIVNYAKLKYSLLIGLITAENVKINLGSAMDSKEEKEKTLKVKGRDLETGLPKAIKFSTSEVRDAIAPVVKIIVQSIKDTIEKCPPELVSDIMDEGIMLAGGGSLLKGIDKLIEKETEMKVFINDDPLTCVVRGCGVLLSNPNLLKKIKVTSGYK